MRVQINLLNAAGNIVKTKTFTWDGTFAEAKRNIEEVVGSPIVASMPTKQQEDHFAEMAKALMYAGETLDFRGQDVDGNWVDVDVRAAA